MKKIVIVLLSVVMIFSSALAFASDSEEEANMVIDTFVLRPIGFAALLVGGVTYIVSLPIALITKSTDKTHEVLLKRPYDYTFVRPVGDVESEL